MLRVEYGLLFLATLWTVLHGLFPSFRDDAWLAVLDLFWPLSMLGMFIIGVKIADDDQLFTAIEPAVQTRGATTPASRLRVRSMKCWCDHPGSQR